MGKVDPHFVELRRKILESASECARRDLEKYLWLYGALGNPRADVMFVCENPSRQGVEDANEGITPLDINTQWRGHRADRFRRVLCQTGLKCGELDEDGGWHCYITNVVKEIWTVKDFKGLPLDEKKRMVREWAKVLQWEICRVQPKIVFCVGRKAEWALNFLKQEGCLDLTGVDLHRIPCGAGPGRYVPHYSMPRGDTSVQCQMRNAIIHGLDAVPVDRCGGTD